MYNALEKDKCFDEKENSGESWELGGTLSTLSVLRPGGAFLWNHLRTRVLLWKRYRSEWGLFSEAPQPLFSSLLLLLGQETCKQHFPEFLARWHPLRLCPGKCWQDWRREARRAFLVFLAEHPGSHSNMAAGNTGSGRSFQPGPFSVSDCRLHVIPYFLVPLA